MNTTQQAKKLAVTGTHGWFGEPSELPFGIDRGRGWGGQKAKRRRVMGRSFQAAVDWLVD